MADVQTGNGYLTIATELFDAITRFQFSKRQYKVILAVIRQTYGFQKTTDDITVTRLAAISGLTRPHASATLDELVALNAVLKRDGKYGYIVGIQKDYEKWGASQNRTPVPKQDGGRPETGRDTVPKRDTQKITQQKITPITPLYPPESKQAEDTNCGVKRFLELCKTAGEKPIPEDDAVFELAAKGKVPREFLLLAWYEFVERMEQRGKRYKGRRGWRQAFRNCIREDWFGFWDISRDDTIYLTAKGRKAQVVHADRLLQAGIEVVREHTLEAAHG